MAYARDTTILEEKRQTSPGVSDLVRYRHFVELGDTSQGVCLSLQAGPPPAATGGVQGPIAPWFDPYLGSNLLMHLRQGFPDIQWPRDWAELEGKAPSPEILEILRLVSKQRAFAGWCWICKEWQSEADESVEFQQLPPVNTAAMVAEFLKSRQGAPTGTLTSYRYTLGVFARYCPTLPREPEELEAYFARFKERQSAASAYAVIKLLYDFAEKRYHVANPMKLTQRPSPKEKEPYSFTLSEAKAVLEACQDDRDLGLIHLYLGHGWRLDEACRLKIGDFQDGQIMVRGKKRTEFMPLLPETREILLRLANSRNGGEPVFLSKRGKQLSHKQTYNVVKVLLKRAGVLEGKASDLRIATHSLRKTFATQIYHAGCDGRVVERLLSHKKRDVTALYIAMPMDSLQQYLERYSPIRLVNNGHSEGELHKIFSCSI